MSKSDYVIEVVRKVYVDKEDVSIDVGPCPDFPGSVIIRTTDSASKEWFGEVRISHPAPYMRLLAQAILKTADEIEFPAKNSQIVYRGDGATQ